MIFILLNNLSVTSQTTFLLIASIHSKVCITFREVYSSFSEAKAEASQY